MAFVLAMMWSRVKYFAVVLCSLAQLVTLLLALLQLFFQPLALVLSMMMLWSVLALLALTAASSLGIFFWGLGVLCGVLLSAFVFLLWGWQF